MGDWTIGIDLGATKIALGLVDGDNRITQRRRIPTTIEQGPHSAVERMAEVVRELIGHLPPEERIDGVGICAPGPVEPDTGRLIHSPNLTGWGIVPLRQMLSDRLDLPVVLEHDAKASALGEHSFGAGRNTTSMVYIVVGTGVGGAIIIDNHIYRGLHNLAGEIGHITIDRNAPPGSSGINGNVESYMSGPFLAQRYRALLETHGMERPSTPVTGATVGLLAVEGDPLAQQIVTEAGEALGILIASLAMILDIEHYVIGSSVATLGDLFLDPARRTVPHFCFRSLAERVRIFPDTLGSDAPILGCSLLARRLRHP